MIWTAATKEVARRGRSQWPSTLTYDDEVSQEDFFFLFIELTMAPDRDPSMVALLCTRPLVSKNRKRK